MPFYVRGWFEATKLAPEEQDSEPALWVPLLSLAPLDLGADAISEYLFGLSKLAEGPGCFGERGVPEFCSAVVRHELESNAKNTKQGGEGNFGHTFAALEEIRAALSLPGAPGLDGSAWEHVLRGADYLVRTPSIEAKTYLRVIVWADW